MQEATIALVRTLMELYLMCFVLRLILQTVRADFRNPLSQFLLKVTDPLVVPLRRLLPAIGRVDTATVVVILGLQALLLAAVLNLSCVAGPGPLQLIGLSIVRLIELVLNTYFFLILAQVIMSWVAPGQYNPMLYLLAQVVEPVLAPFRKLIPAIAGIDLSPLFAILALQFILRILPVGQLMRGLVCGSGV